MSGLTREELTNLAIGMPIVTAIVGALAGLGLGFGLGWALKPDPAPQEAAAAAFTADQITFKCGQVRGEELANANERIRLLETERESFRARVATLEAQLQRPAPSVSTTPRAADAQIAVRRELDEARRQLARVQAELSRAQAEKQQLQEALVATTARLEQTETALVEQVGRTEAAIDEAVGQTWWRFVGEAQLEICERGNRKKLGRCREEVQAALQVAEVQAAFTRCVRSGQARPAVEELEKGASLPRNARYLDESSRVTRDWVVRLCDPTLPEARMGPR
jgi:hypothetical protein